VSSVFVTRCNYAPKFLTETGHAAEAQLQTTPCHVCPFSLHDDPSGRRVGDLQRSRLMVRRSAVASDLQTPTQR
jgi:hypothetical protein